MKIGDDNMSLMAHALKTGRLSLLGALSRDYAGQTGDAGITLAAGRLADAADDQDAGRCVARLVHLAAACDRRKAA